MGKNGSDMCHRYAKSGYFYSYWGLISSKKYFSDFIGKQWTPKPLAPLE